VQEGASEANGDLGKAEEILRIKLGNRASKAASRATGRGPCGLHSRDGKTGALVEVNCETDFVAKNARVSWHWRERCRAGGSERSARRRLLVRTRVKGGT
jgi:translation elongation factor EF-Ts